jgi:hypothetical protein
VHERQRQLFLTRVRPIRRSDQTGHACERISGIGSGVEPQSDFNHRFVPSQ